MTTCVCDRVSPSGSRSRYYGGEQETLEAMEKFRKFYEEKMKEIDTDGGGDCLQLKLKLQEKWIGDLTEQTEMMARIVKELEEEATARVQMLEERLRQTSKTAYEVMKRYQTYNITHNLDEPFQKVFYLENDLKNLLEFIRRKRDDDNWSIEGLQFYDVTYDDLFGSSKDDTALIPISNGSSSERKKESSPKMEKWTHPEFEEMLRKKDEDYQALKQSMLDMRSALTEEVACKHDMISALKKDVQQLEERCVQADKQTAFKDDIIKELRKEIKQLKQQLRKERSEEMEELERKLQDAENLIRSMRPCVETKTAHTTIDDDVRFKSKDKKLEDEICRRQCEVDKLKCRCQELEKALENSQARADNLQKAVDLYLNSINMLEASEERARIEIDQQRVTIANLQEALVNVKQELDDLREKSQQEVDKQQFFNNVLFTNLLDLEEKNAALLLEISHLSDSYKKLQDCSFDLEVEHFNSLQDLAILETQLYKYHNEFRRFEESTKIEVKKLRHQKRCYQHALECLKNEMGVMSEQLISLQEILNLSKQSCIEDKGQLHNAIVNLQTVCDRLHQKLIEAEKKSVIETQMNQLKDQKIDELQVIIGQKNADLNVHDAAIHEMKLKLENAIIENHELQNTITSLNSTMMQLRCDNSKAMSKRNTISFRDDDEKMAVRYDKLKMDYKSQTEMLKSLQKEFERAKEKDKEKTRSLKRQMEALQDKLAKSEMYNHKLISELENLKEQATEMCDKDYCREQQLAQSKNIILELRQTMIELNESLINSEFHHTTLAEAFEIKIKDDRQNEDIYLSCKCEIALYKRLVEDLKGTLGNLKKKFADVEEQNRNLHDELKYRETKLNELQTRLARTEHQTCQNVAELMDKLKRSQAEEKRLCEFIEQLKKEVHKKIVQSHDKRAAPREIDVGSCACGNDNKMTIVGRCACGNENKMAGAGGCACGYENKMAGAGGCACGYENKMAGAGGCACDYEDKMTSAGAPEDSETNIVGCVCCACANENKNPELSCVCNDFNNSDTKIGGCVCNEPNNEMDELETSYEEIKMLKTQIKKLLQSQFSLNNENDKLLKQVTCLQTTLTALEEKNRHLKQKLEKSQCDNQKIREQMKILQREKENLAQTVTNLEVELADVRNNRDDVCAESKHVVSNVKAWLEEQKKINDKVKKKAQCYCDTITKLKQENANLMNQPSPKNYNKLNSMKCYNPHTQSPPPACYTPQSCEYPWCLGSQGMDSPRDSPSSFQTCSVEEWYSPNFRDETDLETDPEEEFLHRLQAATLEMKNNNRKLTNKYKKECDCSVTKDKK